MIKKLFISVFFVLSISVEIFSQAAGTVEEEISETSEKLKNQALSKNGMPEAGAASEKKVALIIGNSSQTDKGMSKYVMDALSMSALLAENDFSVKVTLEGTQKQLLDSLKEYTRNLKNADASFLYFAGEMVSFDGVEYFIPVGSEITNYDELTYKAISLEDVLSTIAKANCKKNCFVIDAGFVNMGSAGSEYIPKNVSVKNYKMESFVVISAADAASVGKSDEKNTEFTNALIKEISSGESSIEEVINRILALNSSMNLLTDSTLASSYYLKNTSAYLAEKTEIIEKEKVTTIFADDLVEGDLRRIAVTSLSDGQLFYVDSNGKEIILGKLKKGVTQAFVLGNSARGICVKYDDGEVEKKEITEFANEFNFNYVAECYFNILAKSPFELYVDGEYFATSGPVKKRVYEDSVATFYSVQEKGENGLKEGEHEFTVVYKNDYYETTNIELVKRKYTDFTAEKKFTYYDGGSVSARVFYGLFNPLLGLGSFMQGDALGGSLVFLGEAIGTTGILLGYDLQKNWAKTAVEQGYSARDIDTTIPKTFVYSGIGIAATSLIYGVFVRPYLFKKFIAKDKQFKNHTEKPTEDEIEKQDAVSFGVFAAPDSSFTFCISIGL